MRVHITLEEDLVQEIDRAVGPRRRSSFIVAAVRKELESKRRWDRMRAGIGSISDEGHPWDEDVARWVHDSRREDPRRVG